ncbi:hypothetical protein N7520_008461, partial [Penicillium odoratum]|uniref:uncharacterized protein n=1 Tax=Penicillium odoratum TaxID=1167516 RepID=UPI002547280E
PRYLALDNLNPFLESHHEVFNPILVAIDDVDPSVSRLKYYFHTPRTSRSSVCDIMTLGDLINGLDRNPGHLLDLMRAFTGRRDSLANQPRPSARENFSEALNGLCDYIYYFDVAGEFPRVKFYAPLRNYARDDLRTAKAITHWMAAQGRSQYC